MRSFLLYSFAQWLKAYPQPIAENAAKDFAPLFWTALTLQTPRDINANNLNFSLLFLFGK
jgi:hypothetical protein